MRVRMTAADLRQLAGHGLRVGCVLCALCVLSACRPTAARRTETLDATADGLRRAAEAQIAGSHAEAANLYREVVRRDPDNALAHFELALLLQDNRDDDAAALYHFRTYLELRPNADKAPIARERMKAAEQRLGRRYGGGEGEGPRPVTDAQIVARIEELNGQLTERDRTIQRLRDEFAAMSKENDRLGKEVKSLDNRLRLMLDNAATTARPPSPALRDRTLESAGTEPADPEADAVPPIPAGARTYRVKRGDSLWSIAQKVYGDASRNRDLRNANHGRVGPNDKLTEGDVLVVPVP